MDVLYADLSWGSSTVRFWGTPRENGAYLGEEGISGWYSTPDSKLEFTERSSGDGAFDVVDEAEILYAMRTVSVDVVIVGTSREDALNTLGELKACTHNECTFRVVDANSDTYVTGTPTGSHEAKWYRNSINLTLTLQCPRPERLSTTAHLVQAFPLSTDTSGGLSYGDSALGLVYPLDYGVVAESMQNTITLQNDGTSRAYPVITVHPTFSEGFRLTLSDADGSSAIEYTAPVVGTPLVLDFRERRASVAGLDRSRYLQERGFRNIAPGSSLTISLTSTGNGWLNCESHDTYI